MSIKRLHIQNARVSGFSPFITFTSVRADLMTPRGSQRITAYIKRGKVPVWSFDEVIEPTYNEPLGLLTKELAAKIRDVSIQLYQTAADYAATRGIIIADTKFEFGLDEDGTLTLMDEVLTPDSSRFWPADSYQEGSNPPSFDKQFVRDWLNSTGWNKEPPAPALPDEIARKTADKYREALTRLIA